MRSPAVATLLVAACSSTAPAEVPLYGTAWLATSAASAVTSTADPGRPVADVSGTVTAVDGVTEPPAGWKAFFPTRASRHALTIRSDDGTDWALGYDIGRGEDVTTAIDETPALPPLAGTRVHLLFRGVNGFGLASGFVLSDPAGAVLLALDLATYGDPLQPTDVAGLTVDSGRPLDVRKTDCYDQRRLALVFSGDAPVEVSPGESAPLTIRGVACRALTILAYEAASPIHCTDVPGRGRAWAVWRAP